MCVLNIHIWVTKSGFHHREKTAETIQAKKLQSQQNIVFLKVTFISLEEALVIFQTELASVH